MKEDALKSLLDNLYDGSIDYIKSTGVRITDNEGNYRTICGVLCDLSKVLDEKLF